MINNLYPQNELTRAELDKDPDFQYLMAHPDEINELSMRNRKRVRAAITWFIDANPVDFAVAVVPADPSV